MEAFLAHIGIYPTDVFAGFAGGILASAVTAGARPNAMTIFWTIIAGAICGSWFGPTIPMLLPASWGVKPGPMASCAVGAAGMPLGRLIIAGTQRLRLPDIGKRSGDHNGMG